MIQLFEKNTEHHWDIGNQNKGIPIAVCKNLVMKFFE